MKTPKLIVLSLALALLPATFAATTDPTPPATPSTTTVNVPTIASELAAGYAQAVSLMSLKSLVIYMRSEGKIVPIKGIRSARAMGAVLLITFSAGDTMAINAEHIIMMTDGARTP